MSKSLTKAEIIEKYGAEYYERFKAKCREQTYARYHTDIEKSRTDGREKYERNKPHRAEYNKSRRVLYRINSRDANRLKALGLLSEGQEAHHLKYHLNKHDETWLDDIIIMSREEHRRWHMEHPEFNALENII